VQNCEFQGREYNIQINIREANWNLVNPQISTDTEMHLNRHVHLASGFLYLLQVWLPRYVWCPVPSSLPVPAGLISTTIHTQSHHSVCFGMKDAHSCRCFTRCDDSLLQQRYEESWPIPYTYYSLLQYIYIYIFFFFLRNPVSFRICTLCRKKIHRPEVF